MVQLPLPIKIRVQPRACQIISFSGRFISRYAVEDEAGSDLIEAFSPTHFVLPPFIGLADYRYRAV